MRPVFATAHLASDAGDGSAKVEHRNKDSREIVRFLKIDMEDVEVDWPLLHHHAFVVFIGSLLLEDYRFHHRNKRQVREVRRGPCPPCTVKALGG